MDITIKIMTVGSKKKNMTVDRKHRFNSIGSVTDSSKTVVGDIDLVAVVGATITTISPPMMQYNGWRHQSGGPSDLHHKRVHWPSRWCW